MGNDLLVFFTPKTFWCQFLGQKRKKKNTGMRDGQKMEIFFPLRAAQRGLESDNLSLAEKKSLLGLWRAWNREWFAPDAGKRHGAFSYADRVLVSLLALACLCPLPSSLAKLQSGRERGCRVAEEPSRDQHYLGKDQYFFLFLSFSLSERPA